MPGELSPAPAPALALQGVPGLAQDTATLNSELALGLFSMEEPLLLPSLSAELTCHCHDGLLLWFLLNFIFVAHFIWCFIV